MTDARDNKTDGGAMKTIFGAGAKNLGVSGWRGAAPRARENPKFVFTRLLRLELQRQQYLRR